MFTPAVMEAILKRQRQFDCFVFCHLTEESPRNLIEALMCGLPIVGYRSSYAENLIEQNSGGILTTSSPSKLATEINGLTSRMIDLTIRAKNDGSQFDAASVFKHRSDLMKAYLIDTGI